MVSKRQRLAKKRYREEHPDQFPKPEPTPPKDPDKKKKTMSKFKRKKSESSASKDPNKPFRKGFTKHPLRVPGMKPGESCYICKAKEHIAKHCPEKAQWEKNKICLLCRHRGHSVKNCPNKNDETMEKKFCYNCGESGHSLVQCSQPLQEGGTKFANCFICNERGHLSKDCPQNTRGIYPKGGCCKICGGVTHLAKDCPNKGYRGSVAAAGAGYTLTTMKLYATGRTLIFLATSGNQKRSSSLGMWGVTRSAYVNEERPRGQVIKFASGDDLEDDFFTDDKHGGNKDGSESKVGSASNSKESCVKPKKKQGPSIVNFVD
uniref:CCHC-type domain-containing protein n=1 Tax=Quercus lobata TaxID=97700 RepID=A0A7N2MI10_QUELO